MDSDLIAETVQSVLDLLRDRFPVADCGEELVHSGGKLYPRQWLYILTSQNCLFILSEFAEIGVRQIAQDFIEHLIASIAKCGGVKFADALFYDHLWPSIRHGLLIKNEDFRLSFIGLVKCVVTHLGKTDRFKDIAALAFSEAEQLNFFENMLSITTAMNSKGLRQLVRFLGHHTVSAGNLKDVLLPLVMHRIELITDNYSAYHKTSLTHAQRESLTSSFEALSAVARQLPVQNYQNLVSEHMSKLDKGVNVELVIKTLIGLLNGYNSAIDDQDHAFMVGILHRLEKHLSKRVASENRHKKAQKSAGPVDLMDKRDAEWTLRGMALQVPVAVAIINIAVRLPGKHLKEIITKVILRICDFLKAKEPEIRKEAGATLLKILEIVNAPDIAIDGTVRFLAFVTHTINTHLDRGFQRHVALYTCHRVLQGLHDKQLFTRLQLDSQSMKNISSLYLDELFGDMAKEKAERNTAEKGIIPEAKRVKAFEGFRLLGNIIDKTLLLDFMRLLVTASQGVKGQAGLQKMQQIFEGLQSKGGMLKNARFDAASLFTLAMLLISDNIEALLSLEGKARPVITATRKTSIDDMHTYTPATRLDGYDAPVTASTNRSAAHLIINCGLNCLHGLAKMHSSSTEIDVRAMLDPLLEYIMRILGNVQYKAILFSAIKCLREIIRANPPSLATRVKDVRELLFQLHHKNSLTSDSQDLLGESLTSVFNKTIAQFLQRADVELSSNHYQLLLLGVQVDSLNNKRQMTSFQLLRALIENRIRAPLANDNCIKLSDELSVKISDIVVKVRTIALLSTSDRARIEARQTIATYLKHYRQTRQCLQEWIVFLLKQLAIDEDGALSACLIIQNIFKEYSPQDIDANVVSSYVVAFIVLAMQEGVTDKVERVFAILMSQVMHAVDTDKRHGLCLLVLGYIDKYDLDSKKLRAAFYLISDMLKMLPDDARASLSIRLVDCVALKLPALIGCADKLNRQLSASQGQDADLMNYLERVVTSVPKKRRLDMSDSDNDNDSENGCDNDKEQDESAVALDKSSDLPDKIKAVMDNISGILLFISSILLANHDNQSDASVLIHLIKSGIWKLVVQKLMCSKHSIVRLNATKHVIQQILSLVATYENESVTAIADQEMTNMIMSSLFSQLKNEQIPTEECNTVLVNLLLLWQIVLARFPQDISGDMCHRIVDSANFIAKQELLSNNSLKKRCAVLKLLAGICAKTSGEALENMKLAKTMLYMLVREERQSQDENAANRKKTASNKRSHNSIERNCSAVEISEWTNLVVSVGEVVRTALGEDNCKRLTLLIHKERAANKLKRVNEESALAVSNPGESLAKKQRKSKK